MGRRLTAPWCLRPCQLLGLDINDDDKRLSFVHVVCIFGSFSYGVVVLPSLGATWRFTFLVIIFSL